MPVGTTIVITGAGSGLGKAWSRGFLADGASVIAADVNPAGLTELEALGAVAVVCDVADEAAVQAMIAAAVEHTGRLDALFNNAGFEEDIRINMLIPGPTNTAIWGREMPHLQPAEATYPTAKLLATLPKGGAHGEVFWDEKPYPIFKGLYEDA